MSVAKAAETRIVILHSTSRAVDGHSLVLQDRNGKQAQGYLRVNGCLQEVNRFKQMHSAWFVGDRVVSDGGLFISTPVDPIFALLPVLEGSRKKTDSSAGMFCSLSDILGDSRYPELHRLLDSEVADANAEAAMTVAGGEEGAEVTKESSSGSSSVKSKQPSPPASLGDLLSCVCEVKDAGGDKYYRLSDEMVLAWLVCKVGRVKTALQAVLQGMDASSQDAYAVSFLAEYVSDRLKVALTTHYRIDTNASMEALQVVGTSRPAGASDFMPEKKQKVVDPKVLTAKRAEEGRMKSKQAALAKEAAGSKKISSFFGKLTPPKATS